MDNNGALLWIVEDDVSTQRMMMAQLKAHGFKPVIFENAEKAYEALLAKQRPELIILDMLLPGMSGIDFARILKQNASWATIPVVVVSVMSRKEAAPKDEQDAGSYWINKPFEPNNLIQTVQKILASIKPEEK